MMQYQHCVVSKTKLSSPSLPHPDHPDKIIIHLSGAEINQEMVLGSALDASITVSSIFTQPGKLCKGHTKWGNKNVFSNSCGFNLYPQLRGNPEIQTYGLFKHHVIRFGFLKI